MRALILKTHGELRNLELTRDYPIPRAAAGHVVIRVRASSFNYHDLFTVKGMPGIRVPLPVVIGLDMAGEITELGDDVVNCKLGDRVLVNPVNKKKGLMGEMLDGGMAEYCLVSADQLVAIPDTVTFAEAASLPVAYGTAHRMLVTHNTVKEGNKVLILGASGGVGTACVIIAKLLGAEVIACASSENKLHRLKEMGADEVIDYTKIDWSSWVIEKYGKPQRRSYEGGVDVVINFTGGDTWVPSLRCIKRGGKLLVCGATAGYDPKEDLRYVWSFEINIQGSNSFYDEDLRGLMALIEDGKMKPVIDKVLPLDQAIEGLRLLRGREVFGKVVVEPGMQLRRLMSQEMTIERVQTMITRAPYHQWLGLKVNAVLDDGIELTATWREEWVVNPERRYTHGGVLAALIDLAADWAMIKKLGRPVPTIDLRVDFHSPALPGDLSCRGKIVKVGSQLSSAESFIFDASGKLLASGRGTYFTAPPKV